MEEPFVDPYLDRVRTFAAVAIVLAGALAIGGSALDWVKAGPRAPELVPGFDFGDQPVEAPELSATGLEVKDGWWTAAGGMVAALAGVALASVRRRGAAWVAFLAFVVIGAIVFADYRGIEALSPAIPHVPHREGGPQPALGIMLVSASAVLGMIGAVAGLAATPRDP